MVGPLFLITLAAAGMFALFVPAILVAIANSESVLASEMALMAALGAFLTLATLTSITDLPRKTERAHTFLALVCVWITTPLFGAVSLVVLADVPFMSAWFEAVGALTTSGASVLSKETAPRALLFWRATLEWYGGFLTLASIVFVLAPGGFGGLQGTGRRLMAGSASDNLFRIESYRLLLLQYCLITAFVLFGLIIFGVRPLDAAMLGMVTAATGGFLPFTGPLEDQITPSAVTVMGLGLFIGTMSVFWRLQILRRPNRIFQNNLEAQILLALIAVLTVAYAARIINVSGGDTAENFLPALREGFFTASSLVATSGIETRPGVVALLPNILVLAVIFVGAGAYSTSGGVKIFRIGAMWVYAIAELNRLIYPNSVDRLKFGDAPLRRESMQAIWTYFIIAVLVIGAGALLIALTATGFEAAIVLAVSLFANAAPIYDALRPIAPGADWPDLPSLPDHSSYLVGILMMSIGRLEVLVVFAILNLKYWYNR